MGLTGASQPSPRWAIIIDCQVTRRKRYYGVVDPDGELRFYHRRLTDCIDFLRSIDQSEADLQDPEEKRIIATLRVTSTKEP